MLWGTMSKFKIEQIDKIYYTKVIDMLSSAIEISDGFYNNDGSDGLPNEAIMNRLIISFKEWLISDEGVDWLSRLGYYKKTSDGQFINADMVKECSVCNTYYNKNDLFVCENCGKEICGRCSFVIDSTYGIRWCLNCNK